MDFTPKKIEGAKIEGLKETPYLKLLRFAFEKAATLSPFTQAEACTDTSLSPDDFNSLKGDICGLIPGSTTDYSITQSALINYLQFVQFEDARAHAMEANKHALTAVGLAIAAIIVSLIVGIPSLFPDKPESLDVQGNAVYNMKLDQTQLDQITNKIEGSKLNTSDMNEIKGILANIKTAIESQKEPAKSGPVLLQKKGR